MQTIEFALHKGEHHDKPHHITQLLHGREHPVVAAATMTHCPREKGTRSCRPKDDGPELRAFCKRSGTNIDQVSRYFEGDQIFAFIERIGSYRLQGLRE